MTGLGGGNGWRRVNHEFFDQIRSAGLVNDAGLPYEFIRAAVI